MKYYYRQHILGYEKMVAEGKRAWHEIHGGGFDDFPSRSFLEEVLPTLSFSSPRPGVLEYGCGTGPVACFLASRGFVVDGIDIIPVAIQVAREIAMERGLGVHYEVQDICELPHQGKKYDIVVDSYCLQGIVTDLDREKVFSAVKARLRPEGYYLVSSAMFDQERYSKNQVANPATGTVYNRYGGNLIDMGTDIVYTELPEGPAEYEDAVIINGEWYLPYRRHRKAEALGCEIEAAGFQIVFQDQEYGGNLICLHTSQNPPD